MNRILLTLLILSCSLQTIAQEYGIAIPVSQDPQTNEWYVLLGLHQDNQWWPFREQLQPGEKANVAAARALKNKTNGVYDVTIRGVPWQKLGNTYYHFVPVNFISGTKLYTTAKNASVSDFVWAPAKDLLQSGPIKPHQKKTTTIVGQSFVDDFQALWPTMVTQLSTGQQTGSTTPTGAGTKTPLGATTKIMGNPGTQWGGNPDAIYFYDQHEHYYEFTNFWPQDVDIDGKIWPTTEQYYQAQKFTDGKLQETIRQLNTPREAFNFARKHKISERPDWKNISLDTMRKAVRAKFTQQKDLAKLLLATGNKIIVEAAGGNDDFYGAGADYNGHNWLGRILMEVRGELQQAVQTKIAPQTVPPYQPQPQKGQGSLAAELQHLTQSLRQLEATL